MEDWLQLVLSNRYISGCLWQNHPAIESNSEKWDSVQTNKMNKDPYHYPCESSLETLAQHLPVLISASPIFTEPPASQKLKLVFTNKKYDKKIALKVQKPQYLPVAALMYFFHYCRILIIISMLQTQTRQNFHTKKMYKK